MISFFKTNARLRAENAEYERVLRGVHKRIKDLLIEKFHGDRRIDELEAKLEDSEELIEQLRERRRDDKVLFESRADYIRDLESRLNQLSHPPRDPVTGQFVKVGL
jgi:hypothetical protein